MEATQNSTPAATTPDPAVAEVSAIISELVGSAEGRAREEVARRILAMLKQSAKAPTSPPAPSAEQLLQHTIGHKLYALSRDVTADDVQTQLSARLSQLSAMLRMTMGAGFQAFEQYNEATRENYLWTCSTLADECEELLDTLSELHAEERAATA